MIGLTLGGIGLFLLGMVLLTEGLRSAAGEALRKVLTRFTRGRLSAFGSGVVITAMAQSSTATVLATIGFVSAGLLTFPQAIGVVLGAAVGTTTTGWIVSLLGLRFSISVFAMPVLGIGALTNLLGRGRAAPIGLALGGFGLIFLGIDTLQSGMEQLSAHIDPADFPPPDLLGRAILVAVGVAMTVVMQSSAAAVTTTLAALHAGTLDLGQAAALVIGQNMGTTATSVVAAIGASVSTRRTAYTQVLFNTTSSLIAFALLPLYLAGYGRLNASIPIDPAVAVAAFHTGFNLLGAAIALPLADVLARVVAALVPERGPVLTRYLDPTVRAVAPVAIEAARRTVVDVGAVLTGAAQRLLDPDARQDPRDEIEAAARAIEETQQFLGHVRTEPEREEEHRRHVAVLHAVDHMERLANALRAPGMRETVVRDPELQRIAARVLPVLALTRDWLNGARTESPVPELRELSAEIADTRRATRPVVLERTAAGELEPDPALRQLDALRWIDRVAYHVWRALVYIAEPLNATNGTAGMAAERPDSDTPGTE